MSVVGKSVLGLKKASWDSDFMSFDRYVDWLEEALDDYSTAQDLYKLRRYSKAAFFSHQACEKALKALLMKKLRHYRPIHSVSKLLEEASSFAQVSDDLMRKASYLDRFFIPTRYPNAWPSGAPHKHYTEEDAKKAIEYAGEILEFVEREVEESTG